ncbi:MAG: RNA polymerase sigma factor [Phycisphaerae bacterium]
MTELPIYARADGGIPTISEPAPVRAGAFEEDAERDLIERAKRDPRAFAVLYRRHYAAIARYLYRRTGNVHTAEDLVAETFETALRYLPRYRYRGVPIRAWLYRIATSAVNRWARRYRKRPMLSLDECSPVDETVALSVAVSDVGLEHARAALLSVKPKHQAVLALHYLEEMSVEEVAAVIGCRIGTVKSRLSRAREALREELTHGR